MGRRRRWWPMIISISRAINPRLASSTMTPAVVTGTTAIVIVVVSVGHRVHRAHLRARTPLISRCQRIRLHKRLQLQPEAATARRHDNNSRTDRLTVLPRPPPTQSTRPDLRTSHHHQRWLDRYRANSPDSRIAITAHPARRRIHDECPEREPQYPAPWVTLTP